MNRKHSFMQIFFLSVLFMFVLFSQAAQLVEQIGSLPSNETISKSTIHAQDHDAVQLSLPAMPKEDLLLPIPIPPIQKQVLSPHSFIGFDSCSVLYATDTSRTIDVMKYGSNYLASFHADFSHKQA
ncbi:hypothetical protein [Virgibacillus sp. Bac330]|uniref:hypothetical protein n=1 Tax=Virgibacillus sp. Bac330 TaxID=2419841 RepID=UPI000EF4DE53|nr:hypothetical protein [Virgibacillus sp. Bac330]